VAESLRRARSGLSSGSRPVGSFLFVGPTGVGKTELARTLASVYFGKEEYLLRLDMSEYQGADALNKLLGTNLSIQDTVFVKHLKNYPFCLFLLDEFEKASKEVLNLFLAVLEDGRLTTAKGETLDLTHSIIIATSNAGTSEIQSGLKAGQTLAQIQNLLTNQILLQYFSPELLNRFDGVILFSPLSSAQVEAITQLQLGHLITKLAEQHIKFGFTETAVKKIATEAFDPLLGARPIRRYLQDHVEGLIAKLLLQKSLAAGSNATLDVKDNEFVIR
jgi:ATP-dependent Clp protease ATP-binding subunit ClpB